MLPIVESSQLEPSYDIAHLAHIELLTPKLEQSLWFFTHVLSLQEVERCGQSVYLRAYGDYAPYTLKLTEGDTGNREPLKIIFSLQNCYQL